MFDNFGRIHSKIFHYELFARLKSWANYESNNEAKAILWLIKHKRYLNVLSNKIKGSALSGALPHEKEDHRQILQRHASEHHWQSLFAV